MKKSAYFFAASLALATVLSCNRAIEPEEAVTPQPAAEALTFRAVLEQPDTKASLNSDYAVVWEAGDQIAVYNGTDWVSSEALTPSDIENNGRYATFTVNIAEGDTYYAVYPASATPSAAVSDDVLAVTLPDVQVIPSGGCVAKDALVQVCKTSDKDNMVFKNISSLVEFKAPEDLDGYVRFEAFDAEGTALQVAGAASVNAAAPAAVSGNAGKVIVKGSFAAGQNYFAVVYPQSGVSSFRFAFSKEDATNGTLKAFKTGSSAIDLPLNGGKKFSDLGTLKWLGPLSTKADLDKWAKYADYYLAGETVKLGADINYEGGTWTPVNGNENNNRFSGLFDGQHHSIYNIIISAESGKNCGFFSNLSSAENVTRAKNLKLGYNPAIQAADGTSKLEGTETSNTRLGVLAGLVDNSNIEYIDNYINLSASQNAEIQIGGIIGRCENTCIIKNCSNYATIDAKTASTGSVYVGGLVAAVSGSNSQVISCSNNGTVQRSVATTKGNSFIAGIVARVGGTTDDVIISNCVNKGSIKHTVNVKNKQLYIGGIIAMDNTTSAEDKYSVIITNCTNEGYIESTSLSNASTGMGIGGIIGYCKNHSKISDCTNLGTIKKINNHNGLTSRFGGIVGWIANSQTLVENCTNGSLADNTQGSITCTLETKDDSSIEYYGGIVGALDQGTVKDCINYAALSTISTENGIIEIAGGIVGQLAGGVLENCNNYGAVSVAAPHVTCGAGGIVGINNCINDNVTGTGCKTKGAISCGNANNAGLVIGMFSSTATTCFGSSDSPVIISDGSVNGTTIDASNYQTYLAGTAAGITASGVASGLNTIWATFVSE